MEAYPRTVRAISIVEEIHQDTRIRKSGTELHPVRRRIILFGIDTAPFGDGSSMTAP